MTIAEFFVELGVKGSDKTISAFKGVKDGMGELKSMSLEAKAAIVGVIYGLERLMSQSAQTGTNLTNFSALTGDSAKTLQQWQYAARQAGVSGDELTGSVNNVRNNMVKMLSNQGAPSGIGLIARAVGIDKNGIKDTFYMMTKMNEFAQKFHSGLANDALKSMGLSEGTIAAMRRGVFRPEIFKQAPTYSDKEIGKLDKVNVAWSNLGQNIQMAFGHFTASHGGQLVADITKLVTALEHLAEALLVLAEKSKLFVAIGIAADSISTLVKLMGIGVDDLTGKHKGKDNAIFGKDSFLKKMLDWRDKNDAGFLNYFKNSKLLNPTAAFSYKPQTVGPQVHVVQSLHFQHDGKDHQKNLDSHRKATQHAYRQSGAQKGGY